MPRTAPDNATLNALRQVQQELLAARDPSGHWTGYLADSALATATAISALAELRRNRQLPPPQATAVNHCIEKGLRWCLRGQNADGGFGDTTVSHSNIATTLLVLSAIRLADYSDTDRTTIEERIRAYCRDNHDVDPLGEGAGGIKKALQRRYGADKTFAVPILANCAIAGLVGWRDVPPLPCEAALIPQSWFRFFRLPVVSYAVPALVAIGQARFLKAPPRNPFSRMARRASLSSGMRLLEHMMPASGGFLEAVPLTAFVTMSLCHTGRADHVVTSQAVQFLLDSFRDEGDLGTWPIDTNLATWNTSLAINALDCDIVDSGQPFAAFDRAPAETRETEASYLDDDRLWDWLLDCQYKTVHPFTGAAPGGWGWSDLSGAVPDADDTPGALLALRCLWRRKTLASQKRQRILEAAEQGVSWLVSLQNPDNGWPTFCRGWGRFPFDRSGTDITAHVLRALIAWRKDLPDRSMQSAVERAIHRGFHFLAHHQNRDGSWSPLWFGNQDHAAEDNPVYGTAKVLFAWRDAGQLFQYYPQDAARWLLTTQHADGSWGGGPSRPASLLSAERPAQDSAAQDLAPQGSVQETALACEALMAFCRPGTHVPPLDATAPHEPVPAAIAASAEAACQRGKAWLIAAINRNEHHERWPIGFYFAKLWYYEALYPRVFACGALRELVKLDDTISVR